MEQNCLFCFKSGDSFLKERGIFALFSHGKSMVHTDRGIDAHAEDISDNIKRIIAELGLETTTYWTRALRSLWRHELGVVKASGKLLVSPFLEQLAEEMAYLASAGFYIPLALGGGVEYDSIPGFADAPKVNGLRVTSPALMDRILPLATENQRRVVEELRTNGVDAIAVPHSVFRVVPSGAVVDSKTGERVDLMRVGEIQSIDRDVITSIIYQNQVPVTSHIGIDAQGTLYNVNATPFAAALVKALGAIKLILLGDTPVRDGEQVVDTIFSPQDLERMIAEEIITKGMVTNLRTSFDLLYQLGPGHTVQITTLKRKNGGVSTGLLEELLGDGSGTKIMLPPLVTPCPLAAFNEEELRQFYGMINAAFEAQHKKLTPDYFSTLAEREGVTVYLAAGRRGGAITYPLPDMPDCEYVCKLFRNRGYEGLGVGTGIMETLYLQKKRVVWRVSEPANEQGPLRFYRTLTKHYGGFEERRGRYYVFGLGIPEDKRSAAIERVAAIPATIVSTRTTEEGTP